MEPNTTNLHQRLLNVSTEVMTVAKNTTVTTGKSSSYKATSDFDVVLAVKKAEANNGVVSIPVKQELIDSQVNVTRNEQGYEKTTYMFIVKMTLRAYNVDDPNDYVDVEGYGLGLDTGDKGFGKASTYARKYCLLNLYKIATGDDPDQWASPQEPQVPELKELTEKNKNMWASAIAHAANGETKEQVNELLRERGYFISAKGWDRISKTN